MHTSGSAPGETKRGTPSPLVGEGGAKRRMRGRVTSPRRSPSRRGDLPDRSPDPSSALRAPSPARGRRGQSGDSAALSAGLPLARFSAGELHEKGICPPFSTTACSISKPSSKDGLCEMCACRSGDREKEEPPRRCRATAEPSFEGTADPKPSGWPARRAHKAGPARRLAPTRNAPDRPTSSGQVRVRAGRSRRPREA